MFTDTTYSVRFTPKSETSICKICFVLLDLLLNVHVQYLGGLQDVFLGKATWSSPTKSRGKIYSLFCVFV